MIPRPFLPQFLFARPPAQVRKLRAQWWAALLLTLLTFVLVSPPAAHAQDATLVWERFDVEITVNDDGSLNVSERQTIRVPSGLSNTAFRTLPKTGVDRIDDWSLSDGVHDYAMAETGDEPYTFTVQESAKGDGAYRIDWQLAPTQEETVTFTFRYTVWPGVAHRSDGDALAWTVIGAEHTLPVETLRVRVVLPAGATLTSAQGYIRSDWKRQTLAGEVSDGENVRWELAETLAPDESFALGVSYLPQGFVAPTPEARPTPVTADADAKPAATDAARSHPDLTAAVLTEDDLPPRYVSFVPQGGLGEILLMLGGLEMEIADAQFSFADPGKQVTLIGITGWTTPERREFVDLFLDNPLMTLAFMTAGERTGLPYVTNVEPVKVGAVGDRATGLTITIETNPNYPPPFVDADTGYVELVMFLRGDLFAFTMLLYPYGAEPEIVLPDLARVWDARLAAGLDLPLEIGASQSNLPITLDDLPTGFLALPLPEEPGPIFAIDPTGRLAASPRVLYMQLFYTPTIVAATVITLTADEPAQMESILADPSASLARLDADGRVPDMVIEYDAPLALEPVGDAVAAVRFRVTRDPEAAELFGDSDSPVVFDFAMVLDGDQLGCLLVIYGELGESMVTVEELLPVMAARLAQQTADKVTR